MSKIFPFAAYRYSQTLTNKDICPPYDVINAAQERKLRSGARNAIHVELPVGEGAKKYVKAQEIWEQWKRSGKVLRDEAPAFYVYEQTFRVEGVTYNRIGFFCELEVEKPGAGSVLRHELTLSGPKQDRLDLIRSTLLNISPIFGLIKDEGKKIDRLLRSAMRHAPLCKVTDSDHVTHQLWLLTHPHSVHKIQSLVAQHPVAIADGHHRYETSWNFSRENKLPNAARTLFFLCPMQERGLVIFPTHRVVRKSAAGKLSFEKLLQRLQNEPLFRVKKIPECNVPQHDHFVISDGKNHYSVSLHSEKLLQERWPKKPKAWRHLALNWVHQIALPEFQKEDFLYSHDLKETLTLLKENKTWTVVVPACSTHELYDIVKAGELMPQKSTYFYPKLSTGIVFRSLI